MIKKFKILINYNNKMSKLTKKNYKNKSYTAGTT